MRLKQEQQKTACTRTNQRGNISICKRPQEKAGQRHPDDQPEAKARHQHSYGTRAERENSAHSDEQSKANRHSQRMARKAKRENSAHSDDQAEANSSHSSRTVIRKSRTEKQRALRLLATRVQQSAAGLRQQQIRTRLASKEKREVAVGQANKNQQSVRRTQQIHEGPNTNETRVPERDVPRERRKSNWLTPPTAVILQRLSTWLRHCIILPHKAA